MFFGWRVVAGSFLSMMMIMGFFTYSVSLLVTPVRDEFGVGLEQVMYSLTLATLFGVFASPFFGVMIDRFPVRLMMTLGCAVMAAGLWLLARVETILAFNLVFALTMALVNNLAGSMASSAAVSRWFTNSRGKALGIAAMGTSIGGILLPALITWWMELSGWRGALDYLALTALLLITPLVWVNVRGKPADIGMLAEGAEEDAQSADSAVGSGMSMAQILRLPAFWYIGLSMGLLFAAYSAILANLSPYATRLGASEVQASGLIMTLALAGLIGKLLFGMAADRISHRLGLWLAQGLLISAFTLMTLEPPYLVMLLAAICLGLSTGGMLPVWNSMVATTFGVASFGRAMGAMGPIITLLVMPGFALVGRLFDYSGSYTLSLLIFIGTTLIAGALLLPLRR